MGLDLQSLFWPNVHSCTHWLRPQTPPPLTPHLCSYTRALLVSQDRRPPAFDLWKAFFVVVNLLYWLFTQTSVSLSFGPNLGTHGIPRKEHFFPRNNEHRSESIPRNFFGKEFRCQPYLKVLPQWLLEKLELNALFVYCRWWNCGRRWLSLRGWWRRWTAMWGRTSASTQRLLPSLLRSDGMGEEGWHGGAKGWLKGPAHEMNIIYAV